jgi:hypothetical protein
MPLMETQRRQLRLLAAMLMSWATGGCAATEASFRIAELKSVAEQPTAGIELMVSGGRQARKGEYPTTMRIESANAPGLSAPQGSAGTCSGVLIEKNLVLTAAHCMCLQKISSSSNKALNRADCATRAKVMRHVRKVEHTKDGGMRIINTFIPFWGSAFLPDEFRVELDNRGHIASILADVAVIRLDDELDIKIDHEPADRGFKDEDVISLAGFGSTSVGGSQEADSLHFGRNMVTGTRVIDYVPKASSDKQDHLGQFHRDYETNVESGDSGGPCFREEGARRFLMGIMLHKEQALGVKTSCLDLFHARPLIESLKKASEEML